MIPAFALACLLFLLAFRYLGIVPRTRTLLSDFSQAMAVMGDAGLTDLEKEKRIQQASRRLMGETVLYLSRLLLVAAIAAVPVLVGAMAGWFTLESMAAFSLRLDVLAITIVTVVLIELVLRKLTHGPA